MTAKEFMMLILTLMLISQMDIRAAGLDGKRRVELSNILEPLQKPGILTESIQEDPGWYEATNRQALKDFITKYPESEEAYQAQVWLIFAQANTETSRDPSLKKQIRAERAHQLELIIANATNPGTLKIAKIHRVFDLFEAGNYAASEKQIDEILTHIKEYEEEEDKQYLKFTELMAIPPAELEPELRDMVVIEECYQHHPDKALVWAEELKNKFPTWETQSVNNAINLLKQGKSPYTSGF